MPIQARIQTSKLKQDRVSVSNKTAKNKINSFVFSFICMLCTKESLVSYGQKQQKIQKKYLAALFVLLCKNGILVILALNIQGYVDHHLV